MSKFSEMCAAFVKGQRARDDYEQRCLQYLGQIIQGFSAYCEFPEGALQVAPLDKKEMDANTRYAIHKAAHETRDGFWHVGVWITLKGTSSGFQWANVLLAFSVAERGGKVLVKGGEKDSPREIDLAMTANARRFTTGLSNKLVVRYLQSQKNRLTLIR